MYVLGLGDHIDCGSALLDGRVLAAINGPATSTSFRTTPTFAMRETGEAGPYTAVGFHDQAGRSASGFPVEAGWEAVRNPGMIQTIARRNNPA